MTKQHEYEQRAQTQQHPLFPDSVPDPRQWSRYVPGTIEQRSPLYQQYTQGIATDPPLQALLALVDHHQPLPITFYCAVNYLLLGQPAHPLADFYPLLRKQPRPAREVYPIFRAFCLEQEQALRALLPTLRLQTNEVTRCANLLPAFYRIYRRGGQAPLALIEVGASAGLNLLWDHYSYTYVHPLSTGGQGTSRVGDSMATVQVHCTLEGQHVPDLPGQMPPIARRIGLDLHPLDIHREEDVRLLRACIWPEERHRYALLDAAIATANQHPFDLLAGEAAALLPEILETIPWEQTICLWHSYALRQGPEEARDRLQDVLTHASLRHTIYRVSLEMEPGEWDAPRLELFTYRQGLCVGYDLLATCDVHGTTMRWRSPMIV